MEFLCDIVEVLCEIGLVSAELTTHVRDSSIDESRRAPSFVHYNVSFDRICSHSSVPLCPTCQHPIRSVLANAVDR